MPINPKSFPLGVEATGEDGVYLVVSKSRPNRKHRVDVTELGCACEARTIHGQRIVKEKGYLPAENLCSHLKAALIFDSMILRTWLARQPRKK